MVEAGSFYELDGGNTSQVPGYGSTFLSFKDLEKNYQLTDWDLITANQSVRFRSLPLGNLVLISCRGSMTAKSIIQQGKHLVEGNLP